MIETTYPELLNLIKPYLAPKRSESASFLIWYLVNFYRLDDVDATDAVCDQNGDKGVDGIYLNEGAGTIDILQSKILLRYENMTYTGNQAAYRTCSPWKKRLITSGCRWRRCKCDLTAAFNSSRSFGRRFPNACFTS